MSFFSGGAGYYSKCKRSEFYSYIWVVDFWTTIGIISSVFGIFSFLKNDAVSLISFLKKILSLREPVIIEYIKKTTICLFVRTKPIKKNY
jgi:hypothetical protein